MDHEDDGALLDRRVQRVILVLEAFHAERDRARTCDDPQAAPFQGDDVIYGQRHVTVREWLTQAISSIGALEALAAQTGKPKLADRQ